MGTSVDVRPLGTHYTWKRVRDEGWKWNSFEPVGKTWKLFVELRWDLLGTESIPIGDTGYSNRIYKQFNAKLNTADERPKFSYLLNYSSSITLAVYDTKSIAKNLAETLSLIESYSRHIRKYFQFDLGVTESKSFEFSKVVSQSITLVESLHTLVTFIRNFEHTLGINVGVKNDVSIAKSEEINILDDRPSFDYSMHLSTMLGIEESFKTIWNIKRWLVETFTVKDSFKFDVEMSLEEEIKLLAEDNRKVFKAFVDLIHLVPEETRSVVFNKLFNESILLSDATVNSFTKILRDKFGIVDEFLRGGGEAILSDIRMLSKAISDSEFEEIISQVSPTGYGPFVPFIPGDYEYKDALYKVAMRTRDLSRPFISQIRYEVDLPDLFDKGEIRIQAKRTTIPFNVKFNPDEPPTVTVVVKAGASKFVPEVDFDVQPDHRSFQVELRNPQNGALVAGKIVWKAQGY